MQKQLTNLLISADKCSFTRQTGRLVECSRLWCVPANMLYNN